MQRQLGIYVHWPYCAAICPYCDFNVYKARARDDAPLVNAIIADLTYWRSQTGPRVVSSIFFGGGTPSLMDPRDVAVIIETCSKLWNLCDHVEIALEANPTDAEAARFYDLLSAGVERLSLGVQSLDDASLKTLGRFHSADEARKAVTLARNLFPRLSIDLIYARPNQTLAAWEDELQQAIDLEADHMSPYQLTIEAGTAFDRAVKRGKITVPEGDLGADFYSLTQERLEASGFEAYEVSNHAKNPASQSRHNLVYWTSQDWIGVGPGAHGRMGWGTNRRATMAAKRPQAYIQAVSSKGNGLVDDELLSLDAMRDEFWLMGLRLKEGVWLEHALGPPLDQVATRQMEKQELVWVTASKIGLSASGRIVGDSVIGKLLGG
jgi:putative oxygen-independent coproporphyrinogen III oxidase